MLAAESVLRVFARLISSIYPGAAKLSKRYPGH